jgi:hypothetical protein
VILLVYPVVEAFAVTVERKSKPKAKRRMNLTERFRWHKTACGPLLSVSLIHYTPNRSRHTKDGVLLAVLGGMAISKHSAKVVIFNCLLIFHDKFSPSLFACFALHFIFDYGGGGVEIRELLHEMFVDVVVVLGKLQG